MLYEIKVVANLFKIESFEFNKVTYYKARIEDKGDLMDVSISSKVTATEIAGLKLKEEYEFTIGLSSDRELKPKLQILAIK